MGGEGACLGPFLKLLKGFSTACRTIPPIAPGDCDTCDINELIYSLMKFPTQVELLLLIHRALSS